MQHARERTEKHVRLLLENLKDKSALWKTQAQIRRWYYNGSHKKWDRMERLGSHGSGQGQAVGSCEALLIFERKIFRRIYGAKYESGEWKSWTNRELEDMSKGENIIKWKKGEG